MTDQDAIRHNMAQGMSQGSPYAREMGFTLVSMDDGAAVMKADYKDIMVGDPDTGVIAGGVVTALLDHCCGSAVHLAMKELKIIATLDLRIDYMRAARPRVDLLSEARCYKLTRTIGFVRAWAFEDDPADPVAAAQATYVINASDAGATGASLKAEGDAA